MQAKRRRRAQNLLPLLQQQVQVMLPAGQKLLTKTKKQQSEENDHLAKSE